MTPPPTKLVVLTGAVGGNGYLSGAVGGVRPAVGVPGEGVHGGGPAGTVTAPHTHGAEGEGDRMYCELHTRSSLRSISKFNLRKK